MRVGFFYPSFCVSRPIDVPSVWTSPRGLTGSELACVMYALEISRRGHSVTLFTKVTGAGDIGRVTVCPFEEWGSTYHSQHWDALCSWMTPEPLKIANPEQFRFFNQQVSDFNLCEPGWESYVDLLAPLSNSHANYMADMTQYPKERWRVLHNGVDTDEFRPMKKEPGKMVWASSHDRGLHWLLEAFPTVKRAVPHASLHIFYNFDGLKRFAGMTNMPEIYSELGNRARYILEAIRRLEGKGVHAHESVSRGRIRDEMSTAEVLAYPCDPVHYTETFGVTVLEACASGAVPVLCTADAFQELWGGVGLNVAPPYHKNKDAYVESLIRALTDDGLRSRLAAECVEHAKNFRWPVLAEKLERCLLSRGAEGLPAVTWGQT